MWLWTQVGRSLYIYKSKDANMVPWNTAERTSVGWLLQFSKTTYL